ncbi:glutamate receptor 2.2, partial [Prunus dulcis]
YQIVTSRDQLRRSTILSALGPSSLPARFCFWELTSNFPWVTHPGIALAPNSLNFGVPTTPKPVSSQKASC